MSEQPPTAADPHVVRRIASGRRRGSTSSGMRMLVGVAPIAAILLVWELAAATALLDPRFFPPPSRVAVTGWGMLWSGEISAALLPSLRRLSLGVVLGALPGVLVGVLGGMVPSVRRVTRPLVAALHPIPKTALLPLVLLLVGVGEVSQYLLVASSVFFIVAESSFVGVLTTPTVYFDVARTLQRSRAHRIWSVALPAALPNILSGLQLGAAVGLAVLVVGEMLIAGSGLGHLVWASWQLFRIPRMFVALAVVGMLGVATQVAIDVIRRRSVAWVATRQAR